MKISELFYSIQGEGKRSGSPSFFIRTNYCNLRCKFSGGNLCDTSYTSWFPDDKKNLGDVEINYILDEYKKINCSDIVITGGEPTIYLDELNELCSELKKINSNSVITIETNGTFITLNNVNYTNISKVRSTYSFPSGHASGSFAIATSLTLRYPDKPVLVAGLYAYALTVSLGRIYWGVHYPSDVFTGMLVGAGSAALIYSLRKPIIKAKNNLFNQSERTDIYQGEVNTTAILLSFAVSDLLNFYLKLVS